MIIKFQETDSRFYFNIEPETVEETAQILRVAAQSKRGVDIGFSFSSEPYGYIILDKMKGHKKLCTVRNSQLKNW